jgi:hypothetical protein
MFSLACSRGGQDDFVNATRAPALPLKLTEIACELAPSSYVTLLFT